MRPLLTPEEMAEADDRTIAAGTPATTLMERAGHAGAHRAITIAGGRYGKRCVVICGHGNNGGDGFVVARLLAGSGMWVRCFAVDPAADFRGAAESSLRHLCASGVALLPFDAAELPRADVIVDAVFGTGFHGVAEGDAAKAIVAINEAAPPVLAVDIPSGVDGATGRAEGPAVEAQVTVVMQAEKIGTAVGAGAALAGQVEVVDIGIDVEGAGVWMSEPADASGVLPRRTVDAHKRSGGSVVSIGGSAGMSGAPILAARAAARAGAGYVTAGVTKAVEPILSGTLPEVLTAAGPGEALGPAVMEALAPALERADAVAIGPGLGTGEAQRRLLDALLPAVGIPLVIDADGLNLLAQRKSGLKDRASSTVLTPHPGELGRLLGTQIANVQSDRLRSAREAAARFDCVVLLKGHRTIVARPDGKAVVVPTGGPELATAGTGDVLTGVVVALLAAGLEPFDAAWAAAYVHGEAGAMAARRHGTNGVVAWDVAEALPAAMASISGERSAGR
ncbi:MAG: NAD(P)H-hydrate dehydratase [Actinomycetota bacterium]|nr:NAD(P)H-hydrate dehydratase [Actinomycetota bacterium]